MEDLRFRYKVCTTCKRKLRVCNFSRNKGTKTGLRANCKECARASKGRWYLDNKGKTQSSSKERREKAKGWVIALKSKPCADCGIGYHHSLMDFDHARGVKVMGIREMITWNYSIKAIEVEVRKCDLVCALCHRIRTWNRQNPNEQIRLKG